LTCLLTACLLSIETPSTPLGIVRAFLGLVLGL